MLYLTLCMGPTGAGVFLIMIARSSLQEGGDFTLESSRLLGSYFNFLTAILYFWSISVFINVINKDNYTIQYNNDAKKPKCDLK